MDYARSRHFTKRQSHGFCCKDCQSLQDWIELLYKTEYLNEKQYLSIKEDSEEIGKILSSITKKMKPNNNQ